MKKCPYCAEEIQDAAIVCRYCRREISVINSIRSNSSNLKLQFDFYEKDEFSIQIEGRWPLFDEKETELFLFTSYVLRQMYNIGDHVIIDALAGALIDNPEKLLGEKPEISDGVHLMTKREMCANEIAGVENYLSDVFVIDAVSKFRDNPFVKALDEMVLRTIPKIVSYRGSAKRQHIYFPEHRKLDIKGFGIIGTLLGKDAGYYAFAASLALYRFLGNKRMDDTEYINLLNSLAEICAKLQIMKQIPVDQTVSAEYILKKVLKRDATN